MYKFDEQLSKGQAAEKKLDSLFSDTYVIQEAEMEDQRQNGEPPKLATLLSRLFRWTRKINLAGQNHRKPIISCTTFQTMSWFT